MGKPHGAGGVVEVSLLLDATDQGAMNRPKGFLRRFAGRHRLVITVVATTLLAAPVASTAGAYVYERSSADQILPGVQVVGIDVGGMSRSEAFSAVMSEADAVLDRRVTITVGERRWVRSFGQLGV